MGSFSRYCSIWLAAASTASGVGRNARMSPVIPTAPWSPPFGLHNNSSIVIVSFLEKIPALSLEIYEKPTVVCGHFVTLYGYPACLCNDISVWVFSIMNFYIIWRAFAHQHSCNVVGYRARLSRTLSISIPPQNSFNMDLSVSQKKKKDS